MGEMIDDYKEKYHLAYLRNWGLLLSILVACFTMKYIFKSFLNQMKKELGNNDLHLARLIYETDENTLARLNSLNKDISFKKFSDKEILIPGELTVCKLKINTLMKGSRAVFKSNFFGGVTIKSDETISVEPGEKSFATELFKRIY
jgi:hypothetical protein